MRPLGWFTSAALMLLGAVAGVGPARAQISPSAESGAQAADAPLVDESLGPSAAPSLRPAAPEQVAQTLDTPSGAAGASAPAQAADGWGPAPDAASGSDGWGDLEEVEEQAAPIFRSKLYGFIDTHLEKVAHTPDSVDENGRTVYAKNPMEFSIPKLHAMVQGAIYDKYRFYLNLAAPGSGSNTDDTPLAVRNAWVELPIITQYLNLRAGKTYRRFGLYNEILDAVPTFIGIEPPEIFDTDHLLLTRTTTFMLHGYADLGPAIINYSATTGNDERGPDAVPIGADVNFDFPFGLRLGSSFYTSGGNALPSRAVGDGSPHGAVVNWMKQDEFYIVGGYAQLKHAGLILQTEYWHAKHNGVRDPDALALLAQDGSLNAEQRRRFFVNGDPSQGIHSVAKYAIDAFYLRAGYEIAIGSLSSITPYLQFDYYRNPETVKNKALGGDDEAGLSDNGRFEKYTVGVVLRPVSQVALKIDGSGHRQVFNGKSEFYPEIRFSLSYLWELAQ